MQTSLTRLTADDGTRLVVHIWLPEWLIDGSLLVADAPEAGAPARTPAATRPQVPGAARPRGIIVIAHGMAEHASRYARFAASAVEEGYAVLAQDHRGHGATAAPDGFGFVAEKGGWDVELDNSSERAVLIVIEDGLLVSGMLFRRVSLAGNLPSLSLDNFSEVKISGTLLSPPSGKTRVQMLEPRTVTGVGAAKPAITTLAPATGAVGAKVTITGTNFNGVREVKFGDKVATFEKDSATQITTYVPRGATGAVNVVVTNNVGASDGKQFTVN